MENTLEQLESQNGGTSEQIFKEINKIDDMLTNISLESERAIKPRRKFKWSREAINCQRACVTLRYEKQIAKQQGDYIALRSIRKEISKQSKELEDILKNQSNAWLKQLKAKLEELPDNAVIKRKRARIKTQIRHMYEKRMFERIKYATGKLKPFRSPQVAIPIGETTQVITEPDEIAQQFRDYNVSYEHQNFKK